MEGTKDTTKEFRKRLADENSSFKTLADIANAFKHIARRPLAKTNTDGKIVYLYGIPSIFSLWSQEHIEKVGVYDQDLKCHRPKYMRVGAVRFKDDLTGEVVDVHDTIQEAIEFLRYILSEIQPRPPF